MQKSKHSRSSSAVYHMKRSAAESSARLNENWGYHPRPGFHDEMTTADGQVRPEWSPLVELLNRMGPSGLGDRWHEGLRLIHDNGVTYNVYGDPRSAARPWPVDPIPFLIGNAEWSKIEAAIIQRATLLNGILGDIYGPQKLLREGKLPPEVVFEHPGFLRPCHGVEPPGGTWLHSYAADIARSPDGRWWVLADRTQAPSGAGYALENRLVSLRVIPDMFRAGKVRRLAAFFQAYRDMLRGLAPKKENPRIVVLTPGPYNETYFEHAFLARYLGYTLVEGADLTVRNNHVFLKTLGGLLPVDVIVRRQDDAYCDPLELRADSMLGVAGLVEAVWAGNVAVANGLGSGVMESAAPAAFLPVLCRHMLGEELKMPNIATWWCGDKQPRKWVEDHLPNLVIKPVSPALDFEPVFGARLNARDRSAIVDRIEASPGAYVAQEQVSLSTVPVWKSDRLEARHLVLRVFAVASGGSYVVMPGGLTRVTSSLDSLVVSMQYGGGSKDAWVLADAPEPAFSLLPRRAAPIQVSRATFDLPSRVADDLYWLGRYVERLEAGVRAARSIPLRLYQGNDPITLAALAAARNALSDWERNREPGDSAAASRPFTERDFFEVVINDERGSLRAIVREIRRLAWNLRDRISGDAWRVLKQLEQQFLVSPPDPMRVSWAQDLLDNTILSLAAFGGLATENMTRGHGWRFLEIGRRLERASQTIELVRRGIGFSTNVTEAELGVVLEIADSTLTYRSRYLNSLQTDLVLDLLLLDEGNPRSAAYQLAKLREHVDQLPESHPAVGHSREARLALGLLAAVQLADATELAKHGDAERPADLLAFLTRLTSDLIVLSEVLTRVYFAHALASRQMSLR